MSLRKFDIVNSKNYELEIDAKLKEINLTIVMGLKTDTLTKHKSHLQKLSKKLNKFYSDYKELLVKKSNTQISYGVDQNNELEKKKQEDKTIYYNLWQLYRNVINQRQTSLYKDFLETGDIIAQSLFEQFKKKYIVRNFNSLSYDSPLTFVGEFNRYDYYVVFPDILEKGNWTIPIISISRSASGTIWSLLAVSHEIGHTVMENMDKFKNESEKYIDKSFYPFKKTIKPIKMPTYLHPIGYFEKEYDGHEILSLIWKSYLEEGFADIMGILFSGPAFLQTGIDLFGGSKKDIWKVNNGAPQGHPPSFLRIYLQCELLKRLGLGNVVETFNDIIELVSDIDDFIYWSSDYPNPSSKNNSFEIDLEIMQDSTKKFLKTMLESKFKSLKNKKITEIVTPFSKKDQEIVEKLSEEITKKHLKIRNLISQYDASPKHILSASRWSVGLYPQKAKIIHKNTLRMIQSLKGN